MSHFAALLCIVSVLSAADAPAGPGQAAGGNPTTFSVITYNVQFLPGLAGRWNERPEPRYRAQRIAEEVSAFDIAALQETFDRGHRARIIDKLREIWGGKLDTVASPTAGNHLTNGGCLILTRFPIVESNSVIFEHYSLASHYGLRADGFAAKGVIHARIALRAEANDNKDDKDRKDYEERAKEVENTIDVFVTHLEARDAGIRELQYVELADFIKKTSDPSRPMLLMGDLNTAGMPEQRNDANSPYSKLMALLNAARPNGGVLDVWPSLKGDAPGGTTEQESEEVGKRIDYIIVGNPAPPAAQLTPTAIRVNLFQDPKVVALSDHNAVEGEFEWVGESP